MNSRFKSFLRGGSHNNLEAIFFSIIFLIYIVLHFHLSFSPVSIFLYIISILIGLWFTHCIDVIFLSLNFKFGRIDETIGPIFNLQQAMKYPAGLFLNSPILVKMIILPVSLLTTVPAVILLWKVQSFPLILIFGIIVLFASVLSELVWRWGLKNYTSAS